MRYFSVAEMAKKWDVSERSVRNYCAHGRVREHLLPERHGTFRKMQKSQSVLIRRKKKRRRYWIFCWMRRQINTLEVFIIRHRLI